MLRTLGLLLIAAAPMSAQGNQVENASFEATKALLRGETVAIKPGQTLAIIESMQSGSTGSALSVHVIRGVVHTGRTGEKTYGFNVVRSVDKDGAKASDNSPVTVYYQSDSAA